MPTKVIQLYDPIGEWDMSAQRFAQHMQDAGGSDIELRICCPGGEAFHGFAIANMLKEHAGKKIAVVDGYCASAATLPAVYCDELHMHEMSMLMVHRSAAGARGHADDIEDVAKVLNDLDALMAAAYKKKTGASDEVIAGWMSRNTWMTPAEALAAGLCDKVISGPSRAPAKALARTQKFFAMAGCLPPRLIEPAAPPPAAAAPPRSPMDRKQIILTLASALALAHEMATAASSSGDTELADIGSKILGADKLPACSELVMPLAQKEGGGDAAQAREMVRTYAAAVKLTGKTEGVPGALEALSHNAALKVEQHAGAHAAEVEQLLAKGQAEFKLTPARCEEWRAAVKSGDRTAADLRSFLASALPAGKVSADPVQGRNDSTSSTPKATDGKPSDPAVAALTDFDLD